MIRFMCGRLDDGERGAEGVDAVISLLDMAEGVVGVVANLSQGDKVIRLGVPVGAASLVVVVGGHVVGAGVLEGGLSVVQSADQVVVRAGEGGSHVVREVINLAPPHLP